MRVVCADCGKFMGEVTIEGQLRKGYASLSVYILCRDCHVSEGAHGGDTVGADDAMETLMGMFGLKK